ncbi:unnamed protein product [Macrosiphum euphorbiae]|uniref:Uncharacterized protein n=1 Tax=Macrosiphum euphorbiae TaxID=13131 RepID=A0AAV0VXM3_9HEMI|nr:unnamed protein product [Macrosiphum euphorbiae]
MLFSKHKAIISSLFVTSFLVQLINCADPDPAAPTDLSASADAPAKPNESDVTSNAGNPKPAQPTPAVNIVTKPTTAQQSTTTSKNGISHNFFCNMICKPYNACRTFLGDAIRSFWESFLKVRENIISKYKSPVTAVNNVGK